MWLAAGVVWIWSRDAARSSREGWKSGVDGDQLGGNGAAARTKNRVVICV